MKEKTKPPPIEIPIVRVSFKGVIIFQWTVKVPPKKY